jgi:hypothetical protein
VSVTFGDELSDGVAFQEFVAKRINSPEPRVWEQLLSPEWAGKTHRALVNLEVQFQKACTNRRVDLVDAEADLSAGAMTMDEFRDIRTDYQEWKARANRYHQSLIRYMGLAKTALKTANRARSRSEAELHYAALKDVLFDLVAAVEQHRQTVSDDYEPTVQDRLLWARLDLVRFPETGHSLVEILRKSRAKQEARQTA